MEYLLAPFTGPVDVAAAVLFVLVFPVYHGLYPLLSRRRLRHTPLVRLDRYRRSWIEQTLARGTILDAVQQTRNLTMANTLLASSALIMMGFTANTIVTGAFVHRDIMIGKLVYLTVALAIAFSYFVAALRYLGQFNLTIGADPKVIDAEEGSAVDYFSDLIGRASHRYTLGIRTFYCAFPLFLWLFSPWLFLLVNAAWGVKLIVFQDFGRRRR